MTDAHPAPGGSTARQRPAPGGLPAGWPPPGLARSARHRAGRDRITPRLRAGLLWPLAALVVVALVTGRWLRGPGLPDDGALTSPAFALLRAETVPGVPTLSPEGMGALQTAVYATVTRAFERHDTLVGAGRELLLVCVLVSALLLWRTARRLGLSDPAGAAAMLLFGALPVLTATHMASTPAALAVPWALLASWLLAGGRPAPAAGVVAAVAAGVATLLAPDVLLLAVAGVAAGLVTGSLLGTRSPTLRLAGALALGPVFVGAALLLDRWDPQPASTSRWDATDGMLLAVTVALAVIGLAGTLLLPRLRAPAVALVVTAATAVAPSPGRLSALQLCLAVAALVLAGLLQLAARRAVADRQRALRPAQALAGVGLVAAAAAAAVAFSRAPASDFGAGAHRAVLAWGDTELPDGAVLVAAPQLWSELVHAGGDPLRVQAERARVPVTASSPAPGPVLRLGGAGAGGRVVARFGSGADEVQVADPNAVTPSPQAREQRRQLAAALLANPTTADAGQATGVLVSGDVDPRLLSLLAALGAQFGVGVQVLPSAPGEEATGTLVRTVVIDSADGLPLPGDPTMTTRLQAWLAAQRAPFLPDAVEVTDAGVRVSFSYVSDPDTLVDEATA